MKVTLRISFSSITGSVAVANPLSYATTTVVIFFQLGIQTPKKATGAESSTVQQNPGTQTQQRVGRWIYGEDFFSATGLSCPAAQSSPSDLDEVSVDRVRKVGNFISHGRGNWLPGRIVH